MSFRLSRCRAVFRKDLLELKKNRGLLWSLLALPAVLVAVPIFVVWAYAKDPNQIGLRELALYYQARLPEEVSPARFMIDKAVTDWFGLYLIMPVFIPILISSQSVAGEKEKRTLEPLLASPVSATELLVGKSFASLFPAVAICWTAYLLLCAGVDWVSAPYLKVWLLPNRMWSFGVLVIAPLFAFLGNGIAVIISAYVAEARLAQQLSGLFVLPLIGLVGAQAAGWLRAGTVYYALEGAVALVLDLGLVFWGARWFDRDRLVSRWL